MLIKTDFKLELLKDLSKYENRVFAERNARFFQTQRGGYGEGDLFLGIRVQQQRFIATKYCRNITLENTEELLQHNIHEVRFVALLILIEIYKKANSSLKFNVMKMYLRNFGYVNNWDLVDLSAPHIPGHYWYENSLKDLWGYAKSGNLWKERTAIVSTFYFIKHGRFAETFELLKLSLSHKHDLIHKASGWMLREIGKIDIKSLVLFLDKYSRFMPRKMLRCSIEKLSTERKEYYLKK
ncbi:MAG: DNA alkylation repair protein [Endomicrobium sp.]|jgi:3-methyladenine DNA glycosylase AlkD|nr:DNA alkylation repair protein [Endomicrobium sp.]